LCYRKGTIHVNINALIKIRVIQVIVISRIFIFLV